MKHLLLLLACVWMLPGCALTREQVPLNYSMNAPLVQSFISKPTDGISVGTIQDRRGVDDPRVIFNKRNLYGDTMSGTWEAEKPVAAIVEDAVRQALIKANYNIISDGAGYQLYGSLLDLRYEVIMGFWQGELRPVLTVQLHLTDNRSGRVIWSETFMGRGSSKGSGILGNQLIRVSLNTALDDLGKQVAESDALRSNLVTGIK